MVRAWLAGVCAVAGVAVLAGRGWALLAAAGLIYLTPVPTRLRSVAARVLPTSLALAGRCWRWLAGRHQVAIVLAVAALVAAPVGMGLVAGVGYALVTFAGLITLGALLLGWDPRPGPTP